MTTKNAQKDLDKLDKSLAKTADDVAKRLFGKTQTEALETHTCISCNEQASNFRDDKAAVEWRISGLCQNCQDYAAGVEEIGKDSP